MPKIVILSLGMLTEPHDLSLIAAVQELTSVQVMNHLDELMPLCAKFNVDLPEEDFRKQFAEILSIDDENMKRFDDSWNKHLNLESPAVEENLKILEEYKATHPDTVFEFFSNTNSMHKKFIDNKLGERLKALSSESNPHIFTTFSTHQRIEDLVKSILESLPENEGVTVLLPDHSGVKIEQRREALNAQNDTIADIADKYNVRSVRLEGKLAEVDLEGLLNKKRPKP